MTILVTGAKGMIGSHLVQGLLDAGHVVIGIDRSRDETCGGDYYHYKADLSDIMRLRTIAQSNKVDRVIHLAALAHTEGEPDLSWEKYYQVNVKCAQNVFTVAFENRAPVLFISTIDVYGFTDGVVNADSKQNPISNYGMSKSQAESELMRLSDLFSVPYTIFRFSPVYTDDIKRDIQKRYYLKYPNLAYRIGKGQEYEILNVKTAIQAMVDWCNQDVKNDAHILKDAKNMWTPDYIKEEKKAGRAKHVLYVPKWMVNCGYAVLLKILGRNEKTYLLNKAVHPLRSE